MGDLEVLETVIDKNGRFISGLGAKNFRGLPHNARLPLTMNATFKGGWHLTYQIQGPWRPSKAGRAGAPFAVEQEDIELSPFKVTAYGQNTKITESFNGNWSASQHATPKHVVGKIPNTIRAMNLERRRMVEQGVNPNTLSTIDNRLITNDDYFTKQGGCGSPKEFFGGFQ